MVEKIDLADPDFEPTDEQLEGLAHRAFADVGPENQKALDEVRARIEKLRSEVRGKFPGKLR